MAHPMSAASLPVDLTAIRAAQARIAPYVHRTPVLTSRRLDALSGAQLAFKCENFQTSGAFKARGAHNAVFALEAKPAAAGVVTHSSGNHGAALALAAQRRGIPAHIVVPQDALAAKVESIRRYGGRVVFCASTHADREATAARVQAETGAHLVHPFDDPWVIAGQATAALELTEDFPDLDDIVTPVGGGGLLGGTGVAAHGLNPRIRVTGTEPAAADDAARSLAAGHIVRQIGARTLADGLRANLSDRTFALLQAHVDAVVTVAEADLVAAMRLAWEVLKIIIEPSSAVALAGVLGNADRFRGRRVGIILTGGNADLASLPWLDPAAPVAGPRTGVSP
jgi:threonine dehydratase